MTTLRLLLRGTPRHFLKAHIPHLTRVLLVESGSRYLLEGLLTGIYGSQPSPQRVDIVTCFSGTPKGFDPSCGEIIHIKDWQGPARRSELWELLRSRHYNSGGIICSGEPVMTKWKWSTVFQVPAPWFLLNENGDYVWFDRRNWRTLLHFVLVRAGLSGSDAITGFGRILLFPFTLLYLLAYAGLAHWRRHFGAGRKYLKTSRHL